MAEKPKPLHQQKAAEFGVSASFIAHLQRRGVVPVDIKAFTKDDDDFLAKISRTLGVHELIRAQLAKLPKERRKQLVQTADDADLKGWEVHAMGLFTKAFREGTNISSALVLVQLYSRFHVLNTQGNRKRVGQLRKIAWTRVRKELSDGEEEPGS